jgi:ceramide glucosyltransferase
VQLDLAFASGTLAILSAFLVLWQWLAAARFRLGAPGPPSGSPLPAVTVLKPLKGADPCTARCLQSWLDQTYPAPVQFLFGVASADDPVNQVVRELIAKNAAVNLRLLVCSEDLGANAKVSTLCQLAKEIRHDIVVISDDDVCVGPDFLERTVPRLLEPSTALVTCFYRFIAAQTDPLAMHWKAIAINVDFWSQVLQAAALKPIDFALGAVMMVRRATLDQIRGFTPLLNRLADDYWLGQLVSKQAGRIELASEVVDLCAAKMGWVAVWKQQLRWARTIRVCQPGPFFFSVLANGTLWPLVWLAVRPVPAVLGVGLFLLAFRCVMALHCQRRLTGSWRHLRYGWMVPVKDLISVLVWAAAFAGNIVEWRGKKFRVNAQGELGPVDASAR